MSDLIDLIGVLGALDDHLVERPELVPEVSELLCPYQYGALGWFREFREWVASRPRDEFDVVPEIPRLDRALDQLAITDDDDEPEPDLGLRLLALTVLARTMDRYGPEGDDAERVVAALSCAGLAEGDSDRGEALLRLLADSDRYPDASTWETMLDDALERGLIAPSAVQPLRCRGKVVDIDVGLTGAPHAATAITTRLVDTNMSFAEATAFLDPAEWPNCCPAWCDMKRAADIGDGTERYQELIGIACPDVLLTTCLGFRRVSSSDNRTAVLAYKLSPPNASDCRSDGEVLVDEGSIEVRDLHPNPGIEVTTTKRVLFKSVAPGPLAMFSCVLGYGDLGDLLVYECARRHPGKKKPKKAKQFPHPPTAPGSGSDDVFGDAAAAARRCVAECVAGYRASMKKLAAGEYTSEDAMADMAGMWKRAAADVATAVELGVRAAAMTRSDDPSDPAPGASS
jgi:hypothetical protein